MGVETTADKNILQAKEKIGEACELLLNVLDEDTWGHNDLREQYINTIHEITVELLKLKRKL